MADEERAARQRELAAQLEGRSDEEIAKGVEVQGVDEVLDLIFAGLAEAFAPSRAAGQSAVIQYDVVAPGGVRTYQLRVADGRCTVARGAAGPARVTLTLALPDLMRLVAGLLNGPQAFMTGKLKIAGDLMLAQVMQTWFAPA
jgi:putative sterol carrier protein